MKFTPMTKEEMELANLLEPGVYGFEVLAALDKISKAGNEMIEVKLNVFGESREAHVYDYLMEKMAFKLRHFAECCGLMADYESGVLDAHRCNGKVGYCKIAVDPGNGDFGPKNVVKDYVPAPSAPQSAPVVPPAPVASRPPLNAAPGKAATAASLAAAGMTGGTFDDDIPFN